MTSASFSASGDAAGYSASLATRLRSASWPISVAFAAILLCGWQLASNGGLVPSYVLAPSEIVSGAYNHLEQLLVAIGNTLLLQLRGLAIGAAIGLAVGLVCGVNRKVEPFIDPVVGLTYPVPKIAIFPAFVIWMGYTDKARITLIAITCFYPVYVAAHSGAKSVAQELVWVAQNAAASRARIFLGVILPSALPRILVGVRIAVVVSFLVTFAVELLTAGGKGIANIIVLAQQGSVYELMWGGIFLFAIVAFICERVVALAGRRATRGQALAAGLHG